MKSTIFAAILVGSAPTIYENIRSENTVLTNGGVMQVKVVDEIQKTDDLVLEMKTDKKPNKKSGEGENKAT